jgi:hypothetical protein
VLLYGSCLRRDSAEGVLDLYVLVDSYRGAYASRALALANAILPPNVVYCELAGRDGTLRAKYAVVSLADFASAAAGRSLDTRIWARFSQPSRLVYARDEAARDAVSAAVETATVTLVEHALAWLPGSGPMQRFSAAELWGSAFRETYRAELRSERPETIQGLVASAPDRYREVTRAALHELERRGRLRVRAEGDEFEVESDAPARIRARRAWRLRRPAAKALSILGLLKTAATFGDWVPYVLWKLERHSGVAIEVSERQRRHPLVLGWPVILRLLRERVLR